ncbi:IS30 family transposase [Shewanella sp.]|uniref:IS30 family transposase n=1 Tax=Shewanella sp. TaxID=50422 RepID=UPI004047F8E2
MSYKHLSQTERYQIYALMKPGQNLKTIAQILGRHQSTISREVLRNSGLRGYRPRQAEILCQQRAQASRNAFQIDHRTRALVAERLNLQWSPEQIAASLPVSHETIYRHVYADKALGGVLWKQLRCQKKKRKRYASGRDRRGQIVGRRPIAERPACVETRSQVGHWEGDTVIGAGHKQAIVTLVERKSGFAVLSHVTRKTSDLVSQAIITSLAPLAQRVRTVTYDNGKEFADHAVVDEALKSTAYFADPFASWQRGSNENFNGLLRQYIPKKRPLSTVTADELKMIQDRINHRPRKRLGFKTPYEVFHQSLKRVALRT